MAEVVVVMSSDEQKLWRAQQKLIEQQSRMSQGYSRVKKESKDAGKEAEGSMSNAASMLTRYAAGLASVSSAVGLVRNMWQEVEQAQTKALETMQALAPTEGFLMQVAQGGTVAEVQADFRGMVERADELSKMSSQLSRIEAQQLVFNARSSQFEDALDFIAQSGAVIKPSAAGDVASMAPALFEGQITPSQAVIGLAAASERSRFNFEQMASGMEKAAAGGLAIGAKAEETFAVLSAIGDKMGVAAASNRMERFGQTIARFPDLAGQGFVHAFRELQAMDEEERKEVLGNNIQLDGMMRAMEGQLDVLLSIENLTKQSMETGVIPGSMLEMRRQAMEVEAGPRLSVERAKVSAEIAREEAMGEYAAQREFMRLKSEERYMESGGGLSAALERKFDQFGDLAEGIQTAIFGRAFTEARLEFASARQSTPRELGFGEELRDAASSLRDAAQSLRDQSPRDEGIPSSPRMQREANMNNVGAE